ncbi:GNAT family N-acetyltransferase [Vulgatibacter sp.]|uniref:GNAT family N-acetyltransferase n=1 Tax=Vulgatibacter sp. TaxID=1971226 RepID=UPI003567768B
MISRLSRADEGELRALLATDPVTYCFPCAILDERGIGSGQVLFHGLRQGGALKAAVAIIGKARLAVPIGGEKKEQQELGKALRGQIRGVIGRRDLADSLWEAGGTEEPWLVHAHRLYRITAEDMGPWTAPGLRLATASDLPEVLPYAAAMQEEETGRDPLAEDPAGYRDRTAARIDAGRLYVLEEDGEVVFQVAMGAVGSFGAQLEGVYTPPIFRGLGYASQGLGQLCRTQLSRLPRLTLTVNEANREAVALYRKLGFVQGAAFRMIRAD